MQVVESALQEAINNQDVRSLCRFLFDFDPTPMQCKIIEAIAYANHKRTIISCMTRYGKTWCIAAGILLYALFNEDKRILLISPTYDQTNILRNYIAHFMTRSDIFQPLLEIEGSGADKLRREFSRKRLVLRNGVEITALSAEGTGNRLMGHGGDVVLLDESCLTDGNVYRSKISRMLGDNPNSILIEIGNPWHRDNHMFQHWINPRFHKIHVGWEVALAEGRITQEFLDEQREQLTPIEWTVLYESQFPEESQDAIFKYSWIVRAQQRWTDWRRDFHSYDVMKTGTDVADKGTDKTVIMYGKEKGARHYVEHIYSENKSENMQVAGRLVAYQEELNTRLFNVDCIGVGIGVVSRLKEALAGRPAKVVECHYGRKSRKPKRFRNMKAEQYWRLRSIFENDLIAIPNDNSDLVRELMAMRWHHDSGTGKICIDDPDEKSPDFADALVYFTWGSSTEGRGFSIG